MKIRKGFVSNSSSSSFVILKSALTEEQIKKVRAFQPATNSDYFDYDFSVLKFVIYGNGGWHWDGEIANYFKEIGVPKDAIEWIDM